VKTATTTTVSTATAPKLEGGCIRKGLAKTVTGELTMTKRFTKGFIQDCLAYIGGSMFIIGLPFCCIPDWQSIGYIISVTGFILILLVMLHKIIFGED